MRPPLTGVVLLAAGAFACGGRTAPAAAPTRVFEGQVTPTIVAASPTFVTPAAGVTSASGLNATATCAHSAQGGPVLAGLRWSPGEPSLAQQVDLTIFNNNFAVGTYQSSQILNPETSPVTWTGLTEGAVYRWQVNTKVDGGGVSSPVGTVGAPNCPP